MAENKDNLDIRLDELLGQLKQRQDKALSRVDLGAQRRQIMRQIAAVPAQRQTQLRPMVIRFAFGSVAAAAAAVLLIVVGLQVLRPGGIGGSNPVAKVDLAGSLHSEGLVEVSLAAPAPEAVAQAGTAKVDYPRMRYLRDQLPQQPRDAMAQVPAGVVMGWTARSPAKEDLPYME